MEASCPYWERSCFLTSQFSVNTVYYWLLNASALTGFIAWLAIAISHYSFRRAYVAQGKRIEDLKFEAKLYPFGSLFAALLCACIIIGQFYAYGDFSILGFFVAYIGLFIFMAHGFTRKMNRHI